MVTRDKASPDWLAVARSPRMLGILALLLLAAAVCIRLGAWQLDRAQIRGEQAAERAAQQHTDAAPVPIDEVLAPQTSVTADVVGTRVLVTGEYLTGAEFVIVEDVDGETGSLVVTGLRVSDGGGAGAVLPVLRGRVDGDAVTTTARLGPGGPLAAPEGTVTVIGEIAASEAALPGEYAPGTLGSISSGQLANLWGPPIYGGYLRLVSSDPPQSADLVPAPAPTASGGLNLQNLAYAAQWWIFGGFAVLLWIRLVRDEVTRRGEPRPE